MESIIRHSPITCNGPIYSTYGNSPYPVGLHCTCCAKSSKAKTTTVHEDPAHCGSGGFCLPICAHRICTTKRVIHA